MNISCSSWSYHRTIKAGAMDQMSWLNQCAELGLDGVELLANHFPSLDRDYLLKLKNRCTELFLTAAMVSARGHLTVADDAARQREVEDIERFADAALFLGAPRVRFFVGSGQELAAGGKELYDKVVQAIRQVGKIGEQRGIVMSLENHGNTTADQLMSILADVGSPHVRLTLDTGNFPPASKVGPVTYESIERCAPHAAIVHAKFINLGPDGGDADFDWNRIVGLLRKGGFNGFLSIEYEGPDADEIAAVRRVVSFLRGII